MDSYDFSNTTSHPVTFTEDLGGNCPSQVGDIFTIHVQQKQSGCPHTGQVQAGSPPCRGSSSKTCGSGQPVTSSRQEVTLALTNVTKVLCDTATDGGNWVIIQRRVDGKEDFDRLWDEYVAGFGSTSGDYWLGLQSIYSLCPPVRIV